MTDVSLAGRTALVTGSTQGIGLSIAKSLASAGAKIVVHGLATREQIDAAMEEVREAGASKVSFAQADLRSADEIAKMMRELSTDGGIDILVNNGGMQQTAPFSEVTTDLWDRMIAINLTAAFHTMRHALPPMAERGFGRVVNIASVHGLVASKEKAPYVASKFGLVGLSRVVALEYARSGSAATGGVTVNCVCPGFTKTVMIEPQIEARGRALGLDREGAIANLLGEKQPSGRLSNADEIGAAVLWLCNPIAHNVTGISLPIDGGWTAQ